MKQVNEGTASRLFALAETYEPTTLAAWETSGTQGDVSKACEIYAKALAGGVFGGEGSIDRVALERDLDFAGRTWGPDGGSNPQESGEG